MRAKHISFVVIAVIALFSIMASPVMACVPPPPPPGESPGYWKRQVKGYVDQQGAVHEDIIALTATINNGPWTTGLLYMGYWLPLLPDIDGDGSFDIDDAYIIFWDGPSSEYKYLWKGLANWYNWARGWAPVA